MKTCYTTQLKFCLVATKSSNDVFIISFRHCLKVDYSQSLRILQSFDRLLTWWPLGLDSNITLIEVAINIERSYLSFS